MVYDLITFLMHIDISVFQGMVREKDDLNRLNLRIYENMKNSIHVTKLSNICFINCYLL